MPDVDTVDLDLVEDFCGVVQERMDVPAPSGLVAEGPAGSSAVFCLGLFAHEPVDEAGELVACGEVFSFEGGAGVAVEAAPSLLAIAFPVFLVGALADTTVRLSCS